MHELSLAQGLLETALGHPDLPEGGRIVGLHLRVGMLSGVDVDSLAFCFEVLARNTPAENATLQVDMVLPVARCRRCRSDRDLQIPSGSAVSIIYPPGAVPLCSCGEEYFDLVGGHELTLLEMEIEHNTEKATAVDSSDTRHQSSG